LLIFSSTRFPISPCSLHSSISFYSSSSVASALRARARRPRLSPRARASAPARGRSARRRRRQRFYAHCQTLVLHFRAYS